MSSLVNFDQKGVFGPALTLIYNSQYYNEKGLLDLANLLKVNFTKLSNVKLTGKKEFCAFVLQKNPSITPAEIIGTRFFQNMRKPESLPSYHEKVLEFIVPRTLNTAREQFPQTYSECGEVKEWAAHLLESCMTEEQINKHCELQSSVSEKIVEERKSIGMELYQAASTKQLTENDLDILIDVGQIAMERLQKADHVSSTLALTGRYLVLFSMNENPFLLGEDVLSLLTTNFREKLFH